MSKLACNFCDSGISEVKLLFIGGSSPDNIAGICSDCIRCGLEVMLRHSERPEYKATAGDLGIEEPLT